MRRTSGSIESQPRLIDLFAGPGGLDVGAAWLGIPSTGIEIDDNACATRTSAGLNTVQGDVRAFAPSDFPDANILAAGPPCQTFTVAGTGIGRRALEKIVRCAEDLAQPPLGQRLPSAFDDERTGLVLEPLRWALSAVDSGAPFEAIVLEQVPAVLPIWQVYRTILEQHGYRVAVGILRTEEYGVPQTRRRAILIARRGNVEVKLPDPTHHAFRRGNHGQVALGLEPWVPINHVVKRPTRFTIISNYGSGGDPKRRGQRRCDEPSATITGKVTRNRLLLADGTWDRLTLHEAGALQTFPPDYPWSGSDIGQQIGNAIPPRLAVHVLAGVLGIEVDSTRLDRLVRMPWSKSRATNEPRVTCGSRELQTVGG